MTIEDYPRAALNAGHEGTVFFTLDVDGRGCPIGCIIVKSSGYRELDDATCPILMRRARFNPAEDGEGHGITSQYSSRFHWQID